MGMKSTIELALRFYEWITGVLLGGRVCGRAHLLGMRTTTAKQGTSMEGRLLCLVFGEWCTATLAPQQEATYWLLLLTSSIVERAVIAPFGAMCARECSTSCLTWFLSMMLFVVASARRHEIKPIVVKNMGGPSTRF